MQQVVVRDVVHHIRENIQYISHFHTGGVPDRHEIDETQELNYRFIMQAIADLVANRGRKVALDAAIGDGSLTVMAGPCSVESREQLLETASGRTATLGNTLAAMEEAKKQGATQDFLNSVARAILNFNVEQWQNELRTPEFALVK